MTSENNKSTHPYSALTPDVVQDALASIGLWGDGRMAALNSFENRVYQIHLESPLDGVDQVVAKFYRPGRWSDAQIAEEHGFAEELVAAEIPAVPPLRVQGETLHHFGGFAFSISPRRGGRRPELDDFEVLEWIGRFLARIHTVGAARPFVERPALDAASFAREPRDWLLEHGAIAPEVPGDRLPAIQSALRKLRLAQGLCPQIATLRIRWGLRSAGQPACSGDPIGKPRRVSSQYVEA